VDRVWRHFAASADYVLHISLPGKKRLSQVEAAKFVEVKLSGEAAKPATGGGTKVEVRLSNGRSLLIEPGFDASHVRALLAVLEAGA
jgi:hypothetical protein